MVQKAKILIPKLILNVLKFGVISNNRTQGKKDQRIKKKEERKHWKNSSRCELNCNHTNKGHLFTLYAANIVKILSGQKVQDTHKMNDVKSEKVQNIKYRILFF